MLNLTNNDYHSIDSVQPFCKAPHLEFMQEGQTVECPLKKGPANMTYVFPIYPPFFINHGMYTVRVRTSARDDQRLFCLFATVIFPPLRSVFPLSR